MKEDVDTINKEHVIGYILIKRARSQEEIRIGYSQHTGRFPVRRWWLHSSTVGSAWFTIPAADRLQ